MTFFTLYDICSGNCTAMEITVYFQATLDEWNFAYINDDDDAYIKAAGELSSMVAAHPWLKEEDKVERLVRLYYSKRNK